MQEGAADGGHTAQQVAGSGTAPAGRRLTYSSDTFRGRKKNKADLPASNVTLLLVCGLKLNECDLCFIRKLTALHNGRQN